MITVCRGQFRVVVKVWNRSNCSCGILYFKLNEIDVINKITKLVFNVCKPQTSLFLSIICNSYKVQYTRSMICFSVLQVPMMGTAEEMKELISKGTFMAFENRVYLAGACNVGKSTLASILLGEEIPQHWKSTDGLIIYFGRNGIHLKDKTMIPLKKGNTT